jgi:hypothetical protein
MDSRQLDLRFKGQRPYIQGPDIFNAATRILKDADTEAWVSMLAFHRFARLDCDLILAKPHADAPMVARGFANTSGGKRPFWIVESDREPGGRYPYDEDSINALASIEGATIHMKQRSSFSPMEEIVALTKTLSYALSPDVDGKWVFGQLNLQRALPHDYGRLVICRTREMAHRFSINRIVIDDLHAGDIRFIVGDP